MEHCKGEVRLEPKGLGNPWSRPTNWSLRGQTVAVLCYAYDSTTIHENVYKCDSMLEKIEL
jgi:hypothetical protein